MTRVGAGDPYATIWPLLMLMGLGMGLVMSPMTAAVMSSVPLRRAGLHGISGWHIRDAPRFGEVAGDIVARSGHMV